MFAVWPSSVPVIRIGSVTLYLDFSSWMVSTMRGTRTSVSSMKTSLLARLPSTCSISTENLYSPSSKSVVWNIMTPRLCWQYSRSSKTGA